MSKLLVVAALLGTIYTVIQLLPKLVYGIDLYFHPNYDHIITERPPPLPDWLKEKQLKNAY